MKNQLFTLGLGLLIVSACSSKEEEFLQKPLSEQSFEFEIYDSLVVDYLGNLVLVDISPNRHNFLFIDQATDTIFVTDQKGIILHRFLATGEGPEKIEGNRSGISKFLNNETLIVPGSRGISRFSIDGKLQKTYSPEFIGLAQLVIPFNETLFIRGDKAYFYMPGRYSDLGQQGIEYQQKSKQLEVLDFSTGKFESFLPFPKESKFSSFKDEFGTLDFYPNFNLNGDSLIVTFRNEPKIFTYLLDQLDTPIAVKTIPFPIFIERGTDEKPVNGGFNVRDFFLGTINKVIPTENQFFLVDYLSGLGENDVEEITALASSDFDKMFEEGYKRNTAGMILFDGKHISQPIVKPEILGQLSKYISLKEIWFSLNFSEAEKDYVVIYKTRLISR